MRACLSSREDVARQEETEDRSACLFASSMEPGMRRGPVVVVTGEKR